MTESQANWVKGSLAVILALVIWAIGQFGILNLVIMPENPLKWTERLLNGALVLALLLAMALGFYLKGVPGKKTILLFVAGLLLSLCYFYLQTQWVVESNCQAPKAPKVYIDPGYVPKSVQSIVRPHIIIQDAWCDAQGKEEVWRAVAKAGATKTIILMVLLIAANVALVFPILFAAWRIKPPPNSVVV